VSDLPTGAVTFLFTDIEGSTRLLHELGAAGYAAALAQHRAALREAFARHQGAEVDTQGDAFFIAFPDPGEALAAAVEAQSSLAAGPIRVRMGIHTGQPLATAEGYVGVDVHKAARICAAGHGGQVLVSESTRRLVVSDLRALGAHRLKDLAEPEPLYQFGDSDFPPLKSLNQTNLPVQPTPFVGRERELAEVLSLLQREDVGVLTLTGPGGSGKTRLAVQAAAEVVEEYPHGVWWIPLQAVSDATLVQATIAQAIGAQAGLAEHLADKHVLLALDNFEQLMPAAPELGELLSTCRHVKVLATSREPLRLRAEQEYAVPPFVEEEAVGFFLARARAAVPGLEGDDAVREVCRRLDHLPLAIELAAARVKALSLEQLLARLDRRLPLLTGGARDAPARQRTLRATIEWSYELLSPEEQQLFVRLAVFVGGCTLEAATTVAGADVDGLASLVDKSLLRRQGERYAMLETIREYAAEALEEGGESETIQRQHAEHYLEIAESANLSLDVLGLAPQRHELVIPEQHNLRAAIEWATDADVELGLRLALALENFWITQDATEGARRFKALLDRADDIDVVLRARALRDYGGCNDWAGNLDVAEAAYARSGELFEESGDQSGMATTFFRLGVIASHRGDVQEARRLYEESLATFQQLGDRIGELQAHGNLGVLEFMHGDPTRGYELTERSLATAREVGWVWWEVSGLLNLADAALVAGKIEDGERHAREAVALAHKIEDRLWTIYGLALLAWAAALRGDAERSVALWAAVEIEEARSPLPPEWQSERERYATHIADGPRPAVALTLDAAVEYALSI
jgi:predicted ATPase